MRRWIGWILFLCLLAGGATTCAIRWEAWFGNPPEPEWTEEKINHQFITMSNDSIEITFNNLNKKSPDNQGSYFYSTNKIFAYSLLNYN